MVYSLGILLLTKLYQENEAWGCLKDSLVTATLVLAALAGLAILLFVVGVYLSRSRSFHHIALSSKQDARQGYTACVYPDSLIGRQGIAKTPLRPAGKIAICGTYYDAITPGTYVASGVAVIVIGVEGTSLTVQALAQA